MESYWADRSTSAAADPQYTSDSMEYAAGNGRANTARPNMARIHIAFESAATETTAIAVRRITEPAMARTTTTWGVNDIDRCRDGAWPRTVFLSFSSSFFLLFALLFHFCFLDRGTSLLLLDLAVLHVVRLRDDCLRIYWLWDDISCLKSAV